MTLSSLCQMIYLKHFNSHAHVERDRKGEKIKNAKSISTHTLTWSVTLSSLCQMIYLKHFNSHAHVERDPLLSFPRLYQIHFNSHAHVERDQEFWRLFRKFLISTHTLTWSVTGVGGRIEKRQRFQLTRSRGA